MKYIHLIKIYFSRPYPLGESDNWLKLSLIAGAVVFFVLYLLRPFGLATYHGNVLQVSVFFTLLAVILTWLYGRFVFRPWNKFVKVWRIGHESLAILLLIITIGIGNSVLDSIIFGGPYSLRLFVSYLYVTLLISIPITLVNVSLGYQQRLRSRLAELLPKETEDQTAAMLTFHDHAVCNDDFTLPARAFLYAEAQKNFVDIYYLHEGKVEKRQLRSTLAAILEDAHQDYIFQCHRSFIVNLNYITDAKGNSNGYQLTMADSHHIVPVSRSYVPKLKSFIR